jgi:hypothetical protein
MELGLGRMRWMHRVQSLGRLLLLLPLLALGRGRQASAARSRYFRAAERRWRNQ